MDEKVKTGTTHAVALATGMGLMAMIHSAPPPSRPLVDQSITYTVVETDAHGTNGKDPNYVTVILEFKGDDGVTHRFHVPKSQLAGIKLSNPQAVE